MADGKVVIETDLDSSGIEKGLKKSEKSMKAQAASMAAEYRKQGMRASDAFKKAWSEIERGSSASASTAKREFSEMGQSAEQAASHAEREWKSSSTGIGSAISKIGSLASKGLKVATVAITGTAAALGGVAAAAIKVGSDFESQMSRVKAISGATGEEFEQLKAQAMQLGADTSFSASQAAEGMENLAAAGFTTSEIMSAMPGLLNLAAASGEDLASSSDIAASTLRGFGLAASDAAHVADVLAANANRTNSSVADTGEAMKYIAPLARAAGLSLEETAAAIGIMANAGVNGSQAGTSLRGALSRLSKPTKDMSEAMDELGISFYDSNGKMKSLTEQVGMLRQATEGMTDEQKNNYLVTLYGQEALSGMLALINEGEGSLGELTNAYKNCDGAAQKAAETMQDNLSGALEQLGGSAETLGLAFYNSVADNLKNAAKTATESINNITDSFNNGGLNEAIQTAGDEFANLAVEAASHAPEMVDTAVDFIESFASGIASNKGRILGAAGEMAESMASGLAELLPDKLQEPVEDAIDAVAESLSDGGLKKAGKTAEKTFDSLIKVVGKLASTALPPLTKALDFAGENLDRLVVVAGSATAAYTAYNATIKATTVATNLATKAQKAFSVAMSASPTGLVIAGIAAATTGLALACATQVDASKELESANDKLGDSYGKIGEGITGYLSEVSKAGSIFDDFNDSIIVSSEVQGELSGKMDAVQSEITEIARTATEERRQLTETEIQRLQDLFTQMRQLTEQELAYQQAYQDAVKSSAETLASTHSGTAEEYATSAQKIINSAVQTRDAVVEKAYSQMIETNAINKQLVGTSEQYTQEWYNQQAQAAQQRYQQAVTDANRESADTLNIIQQGFAQRMDAANEYFANVEASNKRELEEQKRHNDELANAEAEKKRKMEELHQDSASAEYEYFVEVERINEEHKQRLAEIRSGLADSLIDAQAEQASAWLAMIAKTSLYGGELDASSQAIVDSLIDNFDNLPKKQKEIFKNALQGAVDGFREDEPELLTQAQNTSDNFLNKIKEALGVHSPSREVKAIFAQVNPGAIEGLEEGKESLLEKGKSVVSDFLNAMGEESIGEKARGIGASIMNFFGLGVGDQKENSRLQGKSNADAANEGAASVNPFSTGMSFASILKSGISSMMGALFGQGSDLANKANDGSRSVNPTSTGVQFGKQYSSGVKSQSGQSRAGGKELSNAADSGARSKSGRDAGSGFGEGFVSGISDWIGGAINAAANLAANALSAAKRALDEHSPSKKTRKFGQFFSKGLALGIKDEEKSVVKSSRNISNAALESIDLSAVSARMREVMAFNASRVANRPATSVMQYKMDNAEIRKLQQQNQAILNAVAGLSDLAKRPIEVSTTLNGRELIKETAAQMLTEQQRITDFKKLLKGERT
uniref:Minor tail protein n=1 Tax=Siphoviridae sp. ctKFk2 TaxID=2827841 RepID=A0A8S5T0K5_9CAUD|nr:MAG TPA: minor tail protein [Siphoviridae sp. ctKFk2]